MVIFAVMKNPYIVGITGGSASGKTMFLKNLLSAFNEDEVCTISQDNYYKTIDLQPLDDEGVVNFDEPACIDFDTYEKDIIALRSGKTVLRKEYAFNDPSKTPKVLTLSPAPIIVVEGIFVFYNPEIAELIDLKVFIDAEEHIKIKRRIIRDKVERGFDLEDVLYRYGKHVVPTYEKYIEPYKKKADIIIPNNYHFENGLNVLVAFLRTKISSNSVRL